MQSRIGKRIKHLHHSLCADRVLDYQSALLHDHGEGVDDFVE